MKRQKRKKSRGGGGGIGKGEGWVDGVLGDVNLELKVLLKEHKGIVQY